MVRKIFCYAAIITALVNLGSGQALARDIDMELGKLHWLGHDSFRWETAKVIYFDPYQLSPQAPSADIILISHDHFDHYSPDDIMRIRKPSTVVITTKNVAGQIGKGITVSGLSTGDETEVDGVRIKAVASYNINKKFHPRTSGNVGFLVTVDDVTVYHAGDTDFIPEMKDYRCDIALLPVSGMYVMSAPEAAEAALVIQPKIAIPMHYGSVVGSPKDAQEFARILQGKIETKILEKES